MTSRNMQLPHGRRFQVYRSGDRFFGGRQITLNPRWFRSMDAFLTEVSEKVPIFGTVRSIHTPQTGTEIKNMEDLTRNGRYVAAGVKGFTQVPGGYENIGKPIFAIPNRFSKATLPKRTREEKVPPRAKPASPAPIGNAIFTIWIYRNGDVFTQPSPIRITQMDIAHWDHALRRISNTVQLLQGSVSSLYDVDGFEVDPNEIVNNGTYVAVARNDHFQPASYEIIDQQFGAKSSINALDGRGNSAGTQSYLSQDLSIRRPRSAESGRYEDIYSEDRSITPQSYRTRRGSATSLPARTGTEDDESQSPFRARSAQSLFAQEEDGHDDRSAGNAASSGRVGSIEDGYDSPVVFLDRGRPSSDESGIAADSAAEEGKRTQQTLSAKDSGRASLFSDEGHSEEIFWAKAKSRAQSRAVEVDYDTDGSGRYRARSRNAFTRDAQDILESTETRIDVPVDLMEAKEVEEAY